MDDSAGKDGPADPAVRIDAALARIEAAIAARGDSAAKLAKRHAALKARMTEAVGMLDELIAAGKRR